MTCGCGSTFLTRASCPKIHIEVCSQCHPFYTGKQKYVDTAGRVERFQRRYNLKRPGEDAEEPAEAAPAEQTTE